MIFQPLVLPNGEFSMTNPVIAKNRPYKVDAKEVEKYAWCTCGLITNQPFCDGAHKSL